MAEKKEEKVSFADQAEFDNDHHDAIYLRTVQSKRHLELEKWKNEEGLITVDSLLNAAEKQITLRQQRRYLLYGLAAMAVFSLVLSGAVLGLSVAAIQLTKDTSVKQSGSFSRFLDKDGRPLVPGQPTIRIASDNFHGASEEEQINFNKRKMDALNGQSSENLLRNAVRRRQENVNWKLLGYLERNVVEDNLALLESNLEGLIVLQINTIEHISGTVTRLVREGNEISMTITSASKGNYEVHCPSDIELPCEVLYPVITQLPEDVKKRQGGWMPNLDAHFGCHVVSDCEEECQYARSREICQAKADDCQLVFSPTDLTDVSVVSCGCVWNSTTGKCELCFPANALVTLESGEKVPISTISIGTRVLTVDPLTGKQKFSPVVFWKHAGERNGIYLAIQYQVESNSTKVFHISPNHLVYKIEQPSNNNDWWQKEPVTAGSLRVGDYLLLAEDSTFRGVKVTAIDTVVLPGFYAPLTMTGTIVVDGVAASCHSTPYSHSFLETAWAPVKWTYSLLRTLGWISEESAYTPATVPAWPPKDAWYVDLTESLLGVTVA